ncbi:hypothetical protein K3392_02905 [Escherichia coli]|nr:hypothetical protein K3392_02905 [Escherichia coli]
MDAAEEYWKKEIERSNKFDAQPPQMRLVIRGKIIHVGHVKGYTDATFLTLVKRLQALDSEFKIDEQKFRREITDEIHIYTEGVTDTKHFQAALNAFQKRGEFLDLKIIFKNSSKPGSASLKTLCENLRETSQKHLTLCIFDRDEKI